MTATADELRLAELARLGEQAYYGLVLPRLRPEDDEKYVAIDVDTGEYEVDPSELAAAHRLHARLPSARVWMMQKGYDTAHRIRMRRVTSP